MRQSDLEGGLKAAYERLRALEQRARTLPAPEKALLGEALEQLGIDVEELRVARDELAQQNEQLAEAQRTLERERQRYKELFDLAPLAYMVTGYAGLIREANHAAAVLFQREQEFLKGKPLALFLTPGQRRRFRKLLLRLRTGSEVRGWETEMQRSDGAVFPAAMDMTCERSEGHLLGFRWIVEDCTERKRVQALIENARDELERLVRDRTAELHGANDSLEREVMVRRRAQTEQEKFVRLVESASDFIGMADLDGHMVYLNPAGLRMAGLERMEDVLTTPMSHYWTEDTWTCVREAGLPTIEATGRWYGEGQVRNRKTGGIADVEVHLLVVSSPYSDEPPCLCIVQHDVTERKRMERLKNEFVSMVSHELRTPLTSIGGSLGLLAGGVAGELPPEARGMVEIAHRNSERLLRLINDLLDIDKIESGRMDFALRPAEVMSLVKHGIEINLPYAERLGVRFALEGDAPGAKVLIDPDRFLQVLTNLLSNATKFSPRGGTVQVRLTHEDGRVRVTVSDQGPGIPEEFRARIFQKFAQADASDSRQRGGTGLGLSIARALVEKMGGRIGFDTETGQGTMFYFDLPTCETEGLDEASRESPPRGIQPVGPIGLSR